MSKENEKTVEVYKEKAGKYLKTTIEHDELDPERAKRKRDNLNKLLNDSLKLIPNGAKVFEIGAADGENSKYIESLGFNVTASDVADDFISACKTNGLHTINFNVLKDEFNDKYYAIFAWRVFVHFTKEDMAEVLKKTYNALEDGGLFIFNLINRETRNTDDEWVDFSNEYHMGVERYYKYFRQEEIEEIIKNTDYKIQSFHKEGGDNQNKWLVYVLKK